MDTENLLSAIQIGQFHGNPAVKAAGTSQCRVKGLRTVGSCQDHNTGVTLEAIHFRQQLVQSLLPLIVSAHTAAGISFLTDGIDLIDEHDTGCLFLGLLKEVTNLGCTHAHEHLHKFRAGDGEERHICFTGHGLSQHGLAGTGRAYKQHTLGHSCTDFLVLAGVMEIIHDFRQTFLGLVNAFHIGKADAVRGLHINFCIGFAHIEGHGVGAAHFVHHLFGHELSDAHK